MYEIKPNDRLVKIKYEFDHPSYEESKALVIVTISSILALTGLFNEFRQPHPFSIGLSWVLVLFILAVLVGSLIYYIALYRQRRAKIKEVNHIIKHGKMVIGEVVSFSLTEVNGKKDQKNFSYNIEYEDPRYGDVIAITTPTALAEETYIHEKDLPIKVVIYVLGKHTHVDKLINPPLKKMRIRKYYTPCALPAAFALLIISEYLGLQEENYGIAMPLSFLSFALFISIPIILSRD